MICLIRPPSVESVRLATTTVQLPLGLAYVAGALERAGRGVTVVDAVAMDPKRATKYVAGFLMGARLEDVAAAVPAGVDWIGISVIFTHEWPAVVRLVDLLKARLPDVPIVLGGEHVTSMPEFCLMSSRADYLVLGEGEETVTELCDVLDGTRAPREVDGLVFREGGEIVVNKRRSRRSDIDDIAYPAWKYFDVRGYHDNRLTGSVYTDKLTVPILATRGCPYQCTYCSAPNMWTPKWIPRDPIKVVDEIEHWMKTLGAGSFPFQDLTAIIRKDWIVAFCEELLRRDLKITWQLPVGTRSEAIDAEVAGLLARTNMVSMAYAPESGSEETRRLVKKKVHEDALFESVRAAVDARL
ncbi:MAG: B12-binding domain-containing radical SAM protein, partial [Deltaproteobacteria bacterium]|nr:B12-binding domain-containing radical SAM protein [Deltaproteobacteria bacterium]